MTIDEQALEAAARAVLHRRIEPDFFEVKDGAWTVDHDKVVAEAAILAYESAKQKGAEGWVLVPKEPTKAMLDAYGMKAWEIKGDSAAGLLVEGYRAMLATAPKPPSAPLSAGGEG